jgi:hypothetical protein
MLILLGLIGLAAAGMALNAARAQAGAFVYLPAAFRPPPTATPTQTPTPTKTPRTRPSPTPSQAPTRIPVDQVRIERIEYDPPGNDLAYEYVLLRNEGSLTINMKDWTLSDSDGNVYKFPTFSLLSGKAVVIYSCFGYNTSTDLYWRLDRPVWNNDHDCAYLNDKYEGLVDMECY